MSRAGFFLIGAAVGTAVGIVINYVFGPTDDTEYNAAYRSRWDQAVEDGDRAADEREVEMRRQFSAAKTARPKAPKNDAGPLPSDA
jgi:hypothetical protein